MSAVEGEDLVYDVFMAYVKLGHSHTNSKPEIDNAQFTKLAKRNKRRTTHASAALPASYGGAVRQTEVSPVKSPAELPTLPEAHNLNTGTVRQDCGIMRRGVTATDVDICFSKHKKGMRRIDYATFNECVAELSRKRFPDKDEGAAFAAACGLIVKAGSEGPKLHATEATASRFHDDIAQRERERASRDRAREKRREKIKVVDGKGAAPVPQRHRARRPAKEGTLEWQFNEYAALGRAHGDGHAELDGFQFAKYCKDVGIIRKGFSSTDADLMFAKHVPRGGRRVGFTEFQITLQEIAVAVYPDESEATAFSKLEESVIACGGPTLAATHADDVRLSKATIGHVDARRVARRAQAAAASPGDVQDAHSRHLRQARTTTIEEGTLQALFRDFVRHGRTHGDDAIEMDGSQYVKCLRDTGVIGAKFSATDADLAFAKHVAHGARRIDFEAFTNSLFDAAVRIHPSMSEAAAYTALTDEMLKHNAPVLRATEAEDVSLSEATIGHVDEKREQRRSQIAAASATDVQREHLKRLAAAKEDVSPGTLRAMFADYSNLGRTHGHKAAEMDGGQFVHCLRDADVIGSKFSTTDADLCFARHLQRGARRLAFDEFLEALQDVAEALHSDQSEATAFASLTESMLAHGGPKLSGTQAPDVRLHKAEIRHVDERKVARRDRAGLTDATTLQEEHSRRIREATAAKDGEGTLRWLFMSFVKLGHTHGDEAAEMDGAQWSKFARDCGMISRRYTTTAADLDFARYVGHGARRISYEQFEAMMRDAAAKIYPDVDEDTAFTMLVDSALSVGGPILSGTSADEVPLSEATIGNVDEKREARRARVEAERSDALNGHALRAAEVPEPEEGTLSDVFANFSRHGRSHGDPGIDMDSSQMLKWAKDVGLLSRTFTSTDIDLIFTKALSPGARRIGYRRFEDALREISKILYGGSTKDEDVAYQTLLVRVLAVRRPLATGTTVAEDVRLSSATIGNVDEKRERRRQSTGAADEHEVQKQRLKRRAEASTPAEEGTLRWQFMQYAAYGHTHGEKAAGLDGSQWVKYLKDVEVISRKFTTTEADLAFKRHLIRGDRRLPFTAFRTALAEIATKLYPKLDEAASFAALEDRVLGYGGPKPRGTKADDVRLSKTTIGHTKRGKHPR